MVILQKEEICFKCTANAVEIVSGDNAVLPAHNIFQIVMAFLARKTLTFGVFFAEMGPSAFWASGTKYISGYL